MKKTTAAAAAKTEKQQDSTAAKHKPKDGLSSAKAAKGVIHSAPVSAASTPRAAAAAESSSSAALHLRRSTRVHKAPKPGYESDDYLKPKKSSTPTGSTKAQRKLTSSVPDEPSSSSSDVDTSISSDGSQTSTDQESDIELSPLPPPVLIAKPQKASSAANTPRGITTTAAQPQQSLPGPRMGKRKNKASVDKKAAAEDSSSSAYSEGETVPKQPSAKRAKTAPTAPKVATPAAAPIGEVEKQLSPKAVPSRPGTVSPVATPSPGSTDKDRRCWYGYVKGGGSSPHKADRTLRFLRPFGVETCKTHQSKAEEAILKCIAAKLIVTKEGNGVKDSVCGICGGIWMSSPRGQLNLSGHSLSDLVHCGAETCSFSFCRNCIDSLNGLGATHCVTPSQGFKAKTFDEIAALGDNWLCWICVCCRRGDGERGRSTFAKSRVEAEDLKGEDGNDKNLDDLHAAPVPPPLNMAKLRAALASVPNADGLTPPTASPLSSGRKKPSLHVTIPPPSIGDAKAVPLADNTGDDTEIENLVITPRGGRYKKGKDGKHTKVAATPTAQAFVISPSPKVFQKRPRGAIVRKKVTDPSSSSEEEKEAKEDDDLTEGDSEMETEEEMDRPEMVSLHLMPKEDYGPGRPAYELVLRMKELITKFDMAYPKLKESFTLSRTLRDRIASEFPKPGPEWGPHKKSGPKAQFSDPKKASLLTEMEVFAAAISKFGGAISDPNCSFERVAELRVALEEQYRIVADRLADFIRAVQAVEGSQRSSVLRRAAQLRIMESQEGPPEKLGPFQKKHAQLVSMIAKLQGVEQRLHLELSSLFSDKEFREKRKDLNTQQMKIWKETMGSLGNARRRGLGRVVEESQKDAEGSQKALSLLSLVLEATNRLLQKITPPVPAAPPAPAALPPPQSSSEPAPEIIPSTEKLTEASEMAVDATEHPAPAVEPKEMEQRPAVQPPEKACQMICQYPAMPHTMAFYDNSAMLHKVEQGHPESPERLLRIAELLEQLCWQTKKLAVVSNTSEVDIRLLATVHAHEYLRHIESILPATPYDPPAILSVGRPEDEAKDPENRDTLLNWGTWAAAIHSAGGVCDAVLALRERRCGNAFVATRPPGHHVGRWGKTTGTISQGFCVINNVAIGAFFAAIYIGHPRIAVVDIDAHHGNGTEELLGGDDRFRYASLHAYSADPRDSFYPGTGENPHPHNNVLNVPLNVGTGSAEYLKNLQGKILPFIKDFNPTLLLISAGFDGHKADPTGGLKLDTEDYYQITKLILGSVHRDCHVVSVLEGGYNVGTGSDPGPLYHCVKQHLKALLED